MTVLAPEAPRAVVSGAHPSEGGRKPVSFPRYPKYKDSGVEWLGGVPTHWRVAPLKRCYSVCLGKMLQTEAKNDGDELADYIRAANIQKSGVDVSDVKQMWFSQDEIKQLALRGGDLLVSEGGDVGRCAIWNSQLQVCYFQNSVNRVRPRGSNSTRFLAYWLSAVKDSGLIDVICNKSTIAHFTAEKVAAIQTPIPSAAEQEQIAAFLDREAAKIDSLITEQEKLIALLKEKRQALISHAVTKGLDPNAPMKDSGIEWLGDVPAHWEVMQARHLSEFVTSGPRGWSDLVSDDGSVFIQSGDLNDALQIEFDTAKRVSIGGTAEAMRCRLMDGDVVVCITGAKTGNVAVCHFAPEPAYVNQHVCLIRPRANVLPSYLGLVLKSNIGQTQFELFQYGLKQGLSLENIRDMLVALPPTNEQRGITAYLDHAFRKHDALKAEAERAIALLKERRSALISAAVTGKIDVRGEATKVAA